jgi:hypothetical protein
MTRQGRYPQELRECAVRLVFEHQDEPPSQWAAIPLHDSGAAGRSRGSSDLQDVALCSNATG